METQNDQCIDVALEYCDRVNFAMQQNRVPLVDAVRVSSTNVEAIRDVSVSLVLENGEAVSWSARIDRLEPGATFALRPEQFGLSGASLARRTECERTAIVCAVEHGGARSTWSFPLEILPFDQWPGCSQVPELTAAFVTPNHPVVAEFLKGARAALSSISTSDALDGYQSGSRTRVSHIAEACFNAVAAHEIGYINPPASFEVHGQRVRLVDRLAREKLGTCLDLTLLLSSLWEQCGLFPLVLLLEGHAMPAVWTHEAHLPETVIDEPARIRNLLELGEIVAVESTLLTQRGVNFATAVSAARRRMQNPGSMFLAVDIRSARKRLVRPLPLRADGQDGIVVDETAPGAADVEGNLDQIALAERAERRVPASSETHSEPQTPHDRIAGWQRRLLDLSLNNRLINFRWSKRTLGLSVHNSGELENRLADGQRFQILPKAADTSDSFLKNEFNSRQLRALEPAGESQSRLLNLFRIAKASIEETGANTLYLALGLLKWYETESSEQPRLAPIVLLPVTLSRTSAGSGYNYSITLLDEPARSNVTLLEKLRVEFGIDTQGLDRLPEDEHGIDVDLVLRDFRSAIKSVRRWEVTNQAALGLFSFNKFLMWKDLQDNLDRLKQNRLVSHIVDRPGFDFDPNPFPKADELDDALKPDDLLCTRDADSSQLVAVRAAAERRSFVLEGPPGTGKSQTIANIIADSVARNRRVLFVAEKMAALSVVRKRLEDDGLGRFCLELHSAKATKREVLQQLEASLDGEPAAAPADWQALCADLQASRGRLNEYVREMHRPRASGESLYQMLGRLQRLGDGSAASAPTPRPAEATSQQVRHWIHAIESVVQRGRVVGQPAAHPLRGIRQSAWSFSLPQQAAQSLSGTARQLGAMREALSTLLADLGVSTALGTLRPKIVELCVRGAAKLHQSPGNPQFAGARGGQLPSEVTDLIALARRRLSLRDELLARWKESIFQAGNDQLLQRVQRYIESPGVFRLFTSGGIKKAVAPHARNEVTSLVAVLGDLQRVKSVRDTEGQLETLGRSIGFGGDPRSLTLEAIDRLEREMTWASEFSSVTDGLRRLGAADIADRFALAASDPVQVEPLKASCQQACNAWNAWAKECKALQQVLIVDNGTLLPDTPSWIETVGATLDRWRGNLADLNSWCAWLSARNSALEIGLTDLIAMYERGECSLDQLDAAFWRGFGRAWFAAIADSVEVVRAFNGEAHADLAAHFRKLDKQLILLTRSVVTSTLQAQIPADTGAVSAQSERGILKRELGKKTRHLATRKLIEAMPTLLPRLKPCFLMSPLSVAQFLDAKLPPFDVVIFDEASQIPVWDAIGAIARGTNVIVVGDSKQMPPTSFFSTVGEDDDVPAEPTEVVNMESILKECNASGIPALGLKWHYRSRHESLIAFSNAQYYRNELLTFPSPEAASDRLGVSFQYVADGRYDRGGSATNRVEAQAVVDSVVHMLRDPQNRDSIGIVTFSQAQQVLIEDLFDDIRRQSPEIERHFSSESAEPVFIKNLENVQGDERDTIVFSVGYGPDVNGKVSMNFGPLNNEGGERRLNVAVTRARRRLVVFSSLTSDQIDLRRSRATGVAHFKLFLDYAKRGPRAIAEATTIPHSHEFDSGFERSVWKALTDRGWEVDTQVGCAGYRIDLAVRDPQRPGRYLIGIECDGSTYHSAKTARDRDRLRQSVLEGLGWRIARVWSTQWQVNPAGCTKKLLAEFDAAVAEAERPPSAASPVPRSQASVSAPVELAAPFAKSAPVTAAPAPLAAAPSHQTYRASTRSAPSLAGVDLSSRVYDRDLIDLLCGIVRDESPVVEELALIRFARACSVERIRDQFRSRFAAVRDMAAEQDEIRIANGELWWREHDPKGPVQVRVPGEDPESQRDIEHITLAEIAAGALFILKEQFGLPRGELVRETAKLFGRKRVTAGATARIEQGLTALFDTGRMTDHDGVMRLSNPQG